MLFNSIEYALFLPVVFLLYWFVFNRSLRIQNVLLLICSYIFYSFWDWRFLFLLIFSTALDFFSGRLIADSESQQKRKLWLWISIVINLGFLGVFKYYNFFAESFAVLLDRVGFQCNPYTLNIILPVGISFYTFHGLSYVFDLYNRKIAPEKNFINYSVFVCFFPLLVAGPIERATHLLPQIGKARQFDYVKAIDGLRQILWGLFKKIVIADQCAQYANDIFAQGSGYDGSTLWMGAFFFTIQIYGDFSGYSDIALGTARLFGIELLRNFAFPYFSRDIAEFWRRWHISLSSWFRDYLYIPLGGSHGGTLMKIRNTMAIFIVSGFWHGANWTFIFWGLLNAVYFIPLLLSGKHRDNLHTVAFGRLVPSLKELFQMALTFALTMVAWVFFRAEDLHHAFAFIEGMFSAASLSMPAVMPKILLLTIGFFFAIEWIGRNGHHALAHLGEKWPLILRWVFYLMLVVCILVFGGHQEQFIYFQF